MVMTCPFAESCPFRRLVTSRHLFQPLRHHMSEIRDIRRLIDLSQQGTAASTVTALNETGTLLDRDRQY